MATGSVTSMIVECVEQSSCIRVVFRFCNDKNLDPADEVINVLSQLRSSSRMSLREINHDVGIEQGARHQC